MPSPNFSEREGHEVDTIIIHCASLPEEVYGTGYVTDLFLNRLDTSRHPSFESLKDLKVSAHFFIERHGEVIQFVDTDKKAWHAGVSSFMGQADCNLFSIGIELEGDINTPYTKKQYASLIKLCKMLVKKHPLITKERITTHSEVAPGRKTDPGHYFDAGFVCDAVFR